MTKVKLLISLIGKKALAKYLPKVLAMILSRALSWLFKKYPAKTKNVIKELDEIVAAIAATVEAAKDGSITEAELKKLQEKWQIAIDM